MSAIDIRPLRPDDWSAAAAVLARGMRDNPNHIRAFGMDPDRRERRLARLFAVLVPTVQLRGEVFGAFRSGELIGVLGMSAPGRCVPTLSESLRMFPAVLFAIGLPAASRVSRWMKEWSRRDPSDPHWHLGPVAVDRPFQGEGIGSVLMSAFCARMDDPSAGGLAYLETETLRNVHFYERFGFTTVGDATVLGVPNWFMARHPVRV